MAEADNTRTLRLLTLILSAVWAMTLVVRIYKPDWPIGPAADSLMVTAVGFWFSKEGLSKKESS